MKAKALRMIWGGEKKKKSCSVVFWHGIKIKLTSSPLVHRGWQNTHKIKVPCTRFQSDFKASVLYINDMASITLDAMQPVLLKKNLSRLTWRTYCQAWSTSPLEVKRLMIIAWSSGNWRDRNTLKLCFPVTSIRCTVSMKTHDSLKCTCCSHLLTCKQDRSGGQAQFEICSTGLPQLTGPRREVQDIIHQLQDREKWSRSIILHTYRH